MSNWRFCTTSSAHEFIGPSFFEVSSPLPSEAAYCFSCSIQRIPSRVFVVTSSYPAQYKSVSDAVAIAGENDLIPPILLRCGIMDYGRGEEGQHAKPSTEDLFRYLESQIPWLSWLVKKVYDEVCAF